MEKLGVRKEILYSELRDEEAQLMQKLQQSLSQGEKAASDRSLLEARLTQIRNRITELDLQNN